MPGPVEIIGVAKTIRTIEASREKDGIKIHVAFEKMVDVIYNKSQYFVPVDTGDLKKSGRKEVTGKGFGTRGTVSYGGPEAPHAFIVENDLEAHHEPPTCAKYLAKAVSSTRGTNTNILKRQFMADTTSFKA